MVDIVRMDRRRFTAAAALAAGAAAAGLAGAGSANALPGISYDPGPGNAIGIGDNSAKGARASADDGNSALAISIFKPAYARAGGGTGNRALAIDGTAEAGFSIPTATKFNNNRAIAINGSATASAGNNNEATAINGSAFAANGNNNKALAIGSNVATWVDGSNQTLFGDNMTVAGVCGTAVVPEGGNPGPFRVSGVKGKLSGISCLP